MTRVDAAYTIVYDLSMLLDLGTELRNAREQAGASLQAVADSAKISTAYLHKIERGEVNTPSPHVLRRLACSIGVPYLRLMELAGYLDETSPVGGGVKGMSRTWNLRKGKVLVVEDARTASLVIVARDLKDRSDKVAVVEEVLRKLQA